MNFDRESCQAVDSADMLGYIDDLPNQIESAWAQAQSAQVPDLSDVRQVVICGMGGSSISGELLAALVAESSPTAIMVNRGYDLPTWAAGPETLVVGLSHSGTTEETLSALGQGAERGCRMLAVTQGGKLGPLVEQAGGTVLSYQYSALPRASLGWLYGTLLAAAVRSGLIEDQAGGVTEAVDLLRMGRDVLGADAPPENNPAKRTAGQLVERIPIFWGSGLLEPVARRWKTQVNENAKTAAYFEAMPELNHNAVVGLDFPEPLMTRIAIVELVSKQYDHPRVRVRFRASYEIVLQAGIMVDRVTARGESRLAQQMSMIQFGDYLSYYLAVAYEADPSPIHNIVQLKQRLAEVE